MAEHTCVAEINALLKEHNTALMGIITFGPGPERIALATVKADDAVRKKPVLFFATYCPMCGLKLEQATPTPRLVDGGGNQPPAGKGERG